jgi:hypothetical protein
VIFTPKLRLQTICCFVGGLPQAKGSFPRSAYRSLKDHREIFADEGRVRQSQIERGFDTQHI